MEKLNELKNTTKKALETLKEIIHEPYSLITRDAAIQRFEYTFEISWKFLREYLKIKEGIIVNPPKSCFKETLPLKILSEQEVLLALEMTDDRNLTSHTYHEEVAEDIYNKLKKYYCLMEKIYSTLN